MLMFVAVSKHVGNKSFYLQSFLCKTLCCLLFVIVDVTFFKIQAYWNEQTWISRYNLCQNIWCTVYQWCTAYVPAQKKTLKFSSFNFKLSDCPDMLPLSISFIRCGYPLWDGNSKCDIPQFSVGLVWEKRNSVWKHCMNIWARPRWLVPRSPFSNYCSAGTRDRHSKTKTQHTKHKCLQKTICNKDLMLSSQKNNSKNFRFIIL